MTWISSPPKAGLLCQQLHHVYSTPPAELYFSSISAFTLLSYSIAFWLLSLPAVNLCSVVYWWLYQGFSWVKVSWCIGNGYRMHAIIGLKNRYQMLTYKTRSSWWWRRADISLLSHSGSTTIRWLITNAQLLHIANSDSPSDMAFALASGRKFLLLHSHTHAWRLPLISCIRLSTSLGINVKRPCMHAKCSMHAKGGGGVVSRHVTNGNFCDQVQ